MFADEVNGSTSWGVLLPTRSCIDGERLPHRLMLKSIENTSAWAECSVGVCVGMYRPQITSSFCVESLNEVPKSQCCKANTLTLLNSSLEMVSVLSLKGAGVNLLACSPVEGMPWKTWGCSCTGLWAIPMNSATTSLEAIGDWRLAILHIRHGSMGAI